MKRADLDLVQRGVAKMQGHHDLLDMSRFVDDMVEQVPLMVCELRAARALLAAQAAPRSEGFSK